MVDYVISSLLGCKYIIRILCHLRVGPGAAAAAARAGYIPTFESPYFYRQFERIWPTDNPAVQQDYWTSAPPTPTVPHRWPGRTMLE